MQRLRIGGRKPDQLYLRLLDHVARAVAARRDHFIPIGLAFPAVAGYLKPAHQPQHQRGQRGARLQPSF